MKKIAKEYEGDPEAAHFHADKLLCEILRFNGYYRTAELFEELKKYYA